MNVPSRFPVLCVVVALVAPPAFAGAQEPPPADQPTEPPPTVIVQPVGEEPPPPPASETPPLAPPPLAPPPLAPPSPPAQPLPPAPVGPLPPAPPGTATTQPQPAVPLPPPATNPNVPPAPLPPPAAEQAVSDPAWTQLEFLPTARTLREGDFYAHYVGYMGVFGVQYGINGDADIGAGTSLFTIDLAAKYAFVNSENYALSMFAGIAVPFYKGEWPWSAGGLQYVLPLTVGPLFSLWNEKAELDVGVQFIPVLQWHNYNCNADGEECGSKFDGDYLLFPWVAGSIRLGGHARIFGGFAHLATLGLDTWVCEERDPDGDACVRSGTMTARNIPTLFLGFRIHGREFAADIGLHAPLHPDWWEYTDWIIVPFATFGHLW